MPERNYGIVIASLVAVVAVVGLVLNFSGLTGALATGRYLNDQGEYFNAGENFFNQCSANLEKFTEELKVVKGESMSAGECCSNLCGNLCIGLSANCYSGCRSGCEMGSKKAFGSA